MARLRSVDISPIFREALSSSWRGWARLLLHSLRSISGNTSGPPEEFCEIVFIASMMSSYVILMSDSVFPCGCPKKSFGYLIVIVGSGVLKPLYCVVQSVVRSFFCCLVPSSPLHPLFILFIQFQLWSLSCFLQICRSIWGYFLYQQYYYYYCLKKVSSQRLGESDVHPISPKTPAPQYQPIDRKKRKGKRVEDYSRDRAA